MRKRLGVAALLLLFLAFFLVLRGRHHGPLPPTRIGIWYWHSPYTLSANDVADLKRIGVDTLYVRAATFTTDGENLKSSIPQVWGKASRDFGVVLVFNFDAGLRSHFESLTVTKMASDMVNVVTATRRTAERKGVRVTGVQFDVDCPTRLLEKYALLLRQVRSQLSKRGALTKRDTFSATALQTWLASDGYGKLADVCDFMAPQFYEGRLGRTLDSVQPIADTHALANGLNRLSRFGKPYFVGVATYGHALLYDQRGHLANMYHGMGPADALRHPSLVQEKLAAMQENGAIANPKNYAGEDLLVLRATQADSRGRGNGFHIAYVIPTPRMLERQLGEIARNRDENCRGMILYRFPEPNDEMSLPLVTVAQRFRTDPKQKRIDAKIDVVTRSVPWALIGPDHRSGQPPRDFNLHLTATGTEPSLAAQDAAEAVVTFNRTGLEAAAPGGFDAAQTGVATNLDDFEPCAPAHANAVRFRCYHLLPGQLLRSGNIEVGENGPSPRRVYLRVRYSGGFARFSMTKELR